eukprot:RCo037455
MAGFEVLHVEQQPWYEAADRALAREIASPRNSSVKALSIAEIRIPPRVTIRRHYHAVLEEVYYVVSGRGMVTIGEESRAVEAGDAVVIPPGQWHTVCNEEEAGDLRMIVTCSPPWTPDCMIFE